VKFEGECPVAWMENSPGGKGDFEGDEGLLDALNLTLCATVGGTARNADPTLVIHQPWQAMPAEGVRKGGFNAIWSEKGASYLEISGASTDAGLKATTS
jgi:hypothetical protein